MKVHHLFAATALSIGMLGVPAQAADTTPLPWFENFSSGLPAGFTIINANNDGHTWEPSMFGGDMSISTNPHDNDDWLITPAFHLNAGEAYEFSFEAFSSFFGIPSDTDDPETIEVRWGTGATVADMTYSVIEPTDYLGNQRVVFSGWVLPDADCDAYIGIRAMSNPGHYFINVTNLSLKTGIRATRPGPVTDLSVVADTDGKKQVEISFKTPELDIAGNPLNDELTLIEVFRDDVSIATFESPEKGVVLSYLDTEPTHGPHVYSVLATTAGGYGEKTSVDVFVGAREPGRPARVVIAETEKDGEVRVSWDRVSIDYEGNPLNPNLVTYGVYRMMPDNTLEEIETGVTGTELTFDTGTTEQVRVKCRVVAFTEGGESEATESNLIVVGPAYPTPFAESFPNATCSHIFVPVASAEAEWYIIDEKYGIPSQDNDNGFMVMMGSDGYSAELTSGKINLDGLESPCLSFHTYNIARMAPAYPDNNELEVLVRAAGSEEYVSLRKIVMKDLGDEEGWYIVMVPLDEFSGKTIQVRFIGYCHGMTYTLLDNMRIESVPAVDIALKSISAPEMAKTSSVVELRATVENLGSTPVDGYTVAISCDGVPVDEVEGPELMPGHNAVLTFEAQIDPFAEEAVAFVAEVKKEGDSNLKNNTADVATEIYLSRLPGVRNLSGTEADGGVNLTWLAPDLSVKAIDIETEDFENYDSWATENVGAWKFIDADGKPVYGIEDVEFPGINRGDSMSWFVVDGDGMNPLYFMAHSGDKYLGQLYVVGDVETHSPAKCDDWAISPELSGDAQTVSFWARSLNADARESFEFLVSDGGTETSDFRRIDQVSEVQASWTRYSYEVPEGTARFAIRCTSYYSFMLLVDDVVYEAAINPGELEVLGYNIYRDGKLANVEPVTDTAWRDESDATDGEYRVSAIYSRGESRPSDVAEISGTGAIRTDNVSIVTTGRQVRITGASGLGIRISTADGRTVVAETGRDLSVYDLEQGVYIVTAGSKTVKTIVR